MGFYHLLEIFERLGTDDGRTVDNKGRCALYAQLLGYLRFLLDKFRVLPRIQALVELIFVQSQLRCKLLEIVLVERAAIFTILVLE